MDGRSRHDVFIAYTVIISRPRL